MPIHPMPHAGLSDLIGKPFRFGGRGPLEYDCYGLCIEVYRRKGIALPDYGSAIQPHLISRMITAAVDPDLLVFNRLKVAEPFCLVTFTIKPPYTSHIGVVLDNCRDFIHVQQGVKVCIEQLDSILWERRITGFYIYNTKPETRNSKP